MAHQSFIGQLGQGRRMRCRLHVNFEGQRGESQYLDCNLRSVTRHLSPAARGAVNQTDRATQKRSPSLRMRSMSRLLALSLPCTRACSSAKAMASFARIDAKLAATARASGSICAPGCGQCFTALTAKATEAECVPMAQSLLRWQAFITPSFSCSSLAVGL